MYTLLAYIFSRMYCRMALSESIPSSWYPWWLNRSASGSNIYSGKVCYIRVCRSGTWRTSSISFTYSSVLPRCLSRFIISLKFKSKVFQWFVFTYIEVSVTDFKNVINLGVIFLSAHLFQFCLLDLKLLLRKQWPILLPGCV